MFIPQIKADGKGLVRNTCWTRGYICSIQGRLRFPKSVLPLFDWGTLFCLVECDTDKKQIRVTFNRPEKEKFIQPVSVNNLGTENNLSIINSLRAMGIHPVNDEYKTKVINYDRTHLLVQVEVL